MHRFVRPLVALLALVVLTMGVPPPLPARAQPNHQALRFFVFNGTQFDIVFRGMVSGDPYPVYAPPANTPIKPGQEFEFGVLSQKGQEITNEADFWVADTSIPDIQRPVARVKMQTDYGGGNPREIPYMQCNAFPGHTCRPTPGLAWKPWIQTDTAIIDS